MITISGKSASGKDTIINILKNKGYDVITPYTTRPMREGEIEGNEYHFITEDDFMKKLAEGFFAEYRKYETVAGTWYYGSALHDYEDSKNKIIILPPAGVKDIKDRYGDSVNTIYIYASDKTIKKRLISRGDNEEEIMRRMYHDSIDFDEFEREADVVVCNNYGDDLKNVVDKIMFYCERWKS